MEEFKDFCRISSKKSAEILKIKISLQKSVKCLQKIFGYFKVTITLYCSRVTHLINLSIMPFLVLYFVCTFSEKRIRLKTVFDPFTS